MKKTIAFFLCMLMLLTSTSCGNKAPRIPAFSEEKLTEAQSYAYAAIHKYEINKNLSLLSADVLLTEDVTKAIPNNIITKDWTDVQDTRAIVLARYANHKAETGGEKTDADSEKTDADAEKQEIEPSLVMAFFLNEQKETVAQILVSGANSATTSAPAQAADFSAALPIDSMEADLIAALGQIDYNANASTLRRNLAAAELDTEDFFTKNAGQATFAAFAQQAQAAPQTIAGLSDKALLRFSGNEPTCMKYWSKLWDCAILRTTIERLEQIETLSANEQNEAQSLLTSDLNIYSQEKMLLQEYAATAKQIAQHEYNYGSELAPLKQAHAAFSGQDNWWDDIAYLKLCLSSENLNQYDILLRQQRIYESTLDMLQEAEKEQDINRREYIAKKHNTQYTAFSDYSNAVKVYAQCVVNQDNFLTQNATNLSAYEAAEAAAKQAAGAQYADDIDYLKVQITYEDLIKQRNAHESAVTNSKKAADEIRTKMNEEIAKIENSEAKRQVTVKLREYLSQENEAVSEYEAAIGQWGSLHPDFAAYQNEHLTYIVEYVPKNSSGSKKNSASGGMKYDPNDENYRSHDYDNDGKLSDQEFQDAFNDYVDKLLNE